MRATVQISKGKKVAVPELMCDFFIGILKPNQDYIDEKGVQFDESLDVSDLKENQIIQGTITWKNTWLIPIYEPYYKTK